MRKKLFIAAVLIILATPAFLLGRWAYENNQVVGRAKELFNQIPKYPGAIFQEKFHSISSLGYGEDYTVNDLPEIVINYYKGVIGDPWKFDIASGASNSKAILYKYQNFILDISVSSSDPQLSKAKPPYNLSIDISQVP